MCAADLQVLKAELAKGGALPSFHSVDLRLAVSDETKIAPALCAVAEEVGSAVSMGSYPVMPASGGTPLDNWLVSIIPKSEGWCGWG